MPWTPQQIDGYLRNYSSAVALLEELASHGFSYKRVAEFRFCESRGGASWRGIDEHSGVITIFTDCEPGAIAHELGHGFHERLRSSRGLPDQFGEDYAEAIRWFTEQRIGPSSWCGRFIADNKHRAILDACSFDWCQFIGRLKSAHYFPQ